MISDYKAMKVVQLVLATPLYPLAFLRLNAIKSIVTSKSVKSAKCPRLRVDSLYYSGAKQEIVACPPVHLTRIFRPISYFEANKSYHSAPMAT